MAVSTNTYAWTVAVSVLLVAIAAALVAVAILVPTTGVSSFLVSLAVSFVMAVVINAILSYGAETSIAKNRAEMEKVAPKGCPDYWTSEYNNCSKTTVCKPFFETPGRPTVLMHPNQSTRIDISNFTSRGAQSICAETRTYPWMEVTNSCLARSGGT